MQADVTTIGTNSADLLALSGTSSFDREWLRLWLVRILTALLIITGVVLTLYIVGALGFAVYGLPQGSFRRRAALADAA
jgi:hypothetical protein